MTTARNDVTGDRIRSAGGLDKNRTISDEVYTIIVDDPVRAAHTILEHKTGACVIAESYLDACRKCVKKNFNVVKKELLEK